MAVTKAELKEEILQREAFHSVRKVESLIDGELVAQFVGQRRTEVQISEKDLLPEQIDFRDRQIIEALRRMYPDWLVRVSEGVLIFS